MVEAWGCGGGVELFRRGREGYDAGSVGGDVLAIYIKLFDNSGYIFPTNTTQPFKHRARALYITIKIIYSDRSSAVNAIDIIKD